MKLSLSFQLVALLGIFAPARSLPGPVGRLEVAEATIVTDAKGWQSFSFMKEFPDVPVVFVMTDTGTVGLTSTESDEPQAVRIRQITTTGFQASVAEPTGSDGSVGTNIFQYIAASVGIWDLNGFAVEVGRINTTSRTGATCRPLTFPNTGNEEITFQHVFAEAPAFLAYIQTSENEVRTLPSAAPSVPWLVTGAKSVTTTGALVNLDSNTATVEGAGTVEPETIGYMAFENGASSSIEVPSELLEMQLANDFMQCAGNTWLEIFSEKSVRGCFREILTRSDCSKQYINFGRGDFNCGCISKGTDCRAASSSTSSATYTSIYRATPIGSVDCLSVMATGCAAISDRATCLSSTDGRDLGSDATWELTEIGRRCVWCDTECNTVDNYVCEPLDYLLFRGTFKETMEVAMCNSSGSLVPYTTRASVPADKTSYVHLDLDDLTSWPSLALTTGTSVLQSNPLVFASLNTRDGSDGAWVRMRMSAATTSSVNILVEEPGATGVEVNFLQRLADGTFQATFTDSIRTWSFTFPSVDITEVIDTTTGTSVFKDRTKLQLEVYCDQDPCLESLRVGDSTGSFTVLNLASLFTISTGQWQTVTVSLNNNYVSYSGNIAWNALAQLSILSNYGGVSLKVRNLDITNTRGACTAKRSHGAEEVSLVAFDDSFHVEVASAYTITATSTSTTSTSSSTSATTISSSSSTTSTSSTSTSSTSTSSTSTSSTSTSSTSTSSSTSSTTESSTSSTTGSNTSTSSTRSTSSATTTSTSISSTSTSPTSSASSTSTSSSTTTTSPTTTTRSSTSSSSSSSTTKTATSTSTVSVTNTTSTTTTASTSGTSTSTTTSSTTASTTTTSLTSLTITSTSTSSDTFTTTTSVTKTSTITSSTLSTTTSSSLTETAAATLELAILLELEQKTTALVSELLSGNATSTAAITSAVGTMAAVKLGEIASSASFVPAIVEDSPAAAILPLELLELADGAALVMTTFDGGDDNPLASGLSATSSGRTLASVVDAVDISLVDIGNFTSKKVSVSNPIYVRLSDALTPDPAWLCAYLDGDSWSQDGVRLATEEELTNFFGSSVNTTGLWCATYHLSIFSAFVDLVLDCTNVNVLSQDGLEEILQGEWWRRLPALLLWGLLVILICLMVLGVREDNKLYGSGMWRDEFFLTEVPPVTTACSFRCCASRQKEIEEMPTYLAEKTVESLQSLTQVNENLTHMNESLQDWVKQMDLQPKLTDKMNEFILCQNTLRQVAVEHSVHPSFMLGHIWGPEGWVQGSLAIAKSPKLKALQLDMEERLPQAFVAIHSSRLRRFCSTCLATHPVWELWQWNLHMTAAKRAKIIMDCILGSLTFVALFFSVDGTAVAARSPSNCPVQQGTFLWYTFVAIVSILLNLIPRAIIMYFAYRGFVQESQKYRKWQLRKQRLKDVGFWCLGAAISALHLLVIVAFLANLSPVDEWKWIISFTVVVFRKMVVVPLLACLFSGLGTELTAWQLGQEMTKAPPEKLGLDMNLLLGQEAMRSTASEIWEQKVEDLANRGITVRQLLDFYATLGDLMPHFDPESSTTHDVVRQAIIPSSMHFRSYRSFTVIIHSAAGLAKADYFSSDPYCVVRCVASMLLKPWKGGGRTATIKKNTNPTWEEAFVLHEVSQEEDLHFSVWDEDVLSQDDALGEIVLGASEWWDGFHGDLTLSTEAGATLRITVTAYHFSADAVAAKKEFDAQKRKHKRLAGLATTSHTSAEYKTDQKGVSSSSLTDLAFDVEDDMPVSFQLDAMHEKRRYTIQASRGVLLNDFQEDLRCAGIRFTDEGDESDDQAVKDSTVGELSPLKGPVGYAFASCVNMGRRRLGQKMVTHSWRNRFSFLIGAILADALNSELYDKVVVMLQQRRFEDLCAALERYGKLDVAYWVCAFSVNQHAGICANPPATDSMGYQILPCNCCTEKHFQGDFCEMNKFDSMMAFLKWRLRSNFADVRLEQVVAMEPDFGLLSRVWCIAELVESRKLHLPQAIMIHSAASRAKCLERLFNLDVREAEASFPADKDLILNKITDVEMFNRQLRDLILHRLDTFLETNSSRLAATILDELVLAVCTVAI